jgi:protease IV
MRFLGNVLATIIGMFVFFMMLFFGILLIGAIFSTDSVAVSTENNSVIELDLSLVAEDYGGKIFYKDFDRYESNHD